MSSRAGEPVLFIRKTADSTPARTPTPEDARLQEWIDLSRKVEKIEPFLVLTIQGLGLLDHELRQQNRTFTLDPSDWADPQKEQWALAATEWQFRSYLWILASYEVVRFANANLGSLGAIGPDVRKTWRDLKKRYERIRIPLAKFRPSGDARGTDNGVAYPVVPGSSGAGWRLNENEVVWRDDLASQLLDALRQVP